LPPLLERLLHSPFVVALNYVLAILGSG
jgi:hypothetical protein